MIMHKDLQEPEKEACNSEYWAKYSNQDVAKLRNKILCFEALPRGDVTVSAQEL